MKLQISKIFHKIKLRKGPFLLLSLGISATLAGKLYIHYTNNSTEESEQTKTEKDTPKSNEETSTLKYRGIINEGTTCYLNSVVQTFYHTDFFKKIIFNTVTRRSGRDIVHQLKKCFYKLEHVNGSSSSNDSFSWFGLSGNDFVSIRNLSDSFGWTEEDYYVQHDINELIIKFIECIENKLKRNKQYEDVMEFLFHIKQKNVIESNESKFKSKRLESYLTLRLTVGNDVSKNDSLKNSLKRYFKAVDLVDDNKYRLPTGEYVNATKKSSFVRLPPILMIQLERFNFTQIGVVKNSCGFEFSNECEFILEDENDKEKKVKYELFSVLVHSGVGSNSGHYFSYIKKKGEWWEFNDEKVNKVSSVEAIEENYGGGFSSQCAYMLMYVKKSLWNIVFQEVKVPNDVKKEFGKNRDGCTIS